MNLDKLKQLATNASPLPWEPPSDVPHSVRWAFREAVRPEDVLALIEVAEKAEDLAGDVVALVEIISALSDREIPDHAPVLRKAVALRSALSRLNGGQE